MCWGCERQEGMREWEGKCEQTRGDYVHDRVYLSTARFLFTKTKKNPSKISSLMFFIFKQKFNYDFLCIMVINNRSLTTIAVFRK